MIDAIERRFDDWKSGWRAVSPPPQNTEKAYERSFSAGTGCPGRQRSQGWQVLVAKLLASHPAFAGNPWLAAIGEHPGTRPTPGEGTIYIGADTAPELRTLIAAELDRLARERFTAHNASGMPGCMKPDQWRYTGGDWS